jgi:hypothetical protein
MKNTARQVSPMSARTAVLSTLRSRVLRIELMELILNTQPSFVKTNG